MIQSQPMKMAAAEALWTSEAPASFSLFTIGDEKKRGDVFAIRIPTLLSILAYNRTTGEVKGINDLQAEYQQKYGPGDYVPQPIWLIYWSFRGMVGAGTLMVLLSLLSLAFLLRGTLERRRWLLALLVPAIALPYLGNAFGWMMTEMGRQPWAVFGVLKTEAGVSPIGAGNVLLSLVLFTVLYGALAVVDLYLLLKFSGITGATGESTVEAGPETAGAY
jgi:cytochrome d ubiquinol oxidase subunit I